MKFEMIKSNRNSAHRINKTQTYKSVQANEEINDLPDIENYLGAHKKFKTDFKSKRYKNVYSSLISRKPAQPEYMPLFYQDLLVSIIKLIKVATITRENMSA